MTENNKLPIILETHITGFVSIEADIKTGTHDFGIQIDNYGKVWICIDGVAFIRFKPSKIMLNLRGEK